MSQPFKDSVNISQPQQQVQSNTTGNNANVNPFEKNNNMNNESASNHCGTQQQNEPSVKQNGITEPSLNQPQINNQSSNNLVAPGISNPFQPFIDSTMANDAKNLCKQVTSQNEVPAQSQISVPDKKPLLPILKLKPLNQGESKTFSVGPHIIKTAAVQSTFQVQNTMNCQSVAKPLAPIQSQSGIQVQQNGEKSNSVKIPQLVPANTISSTGILIQENKQEMEQPNSAQPKEQRDASNDGNKAVEKIYASKEVSNFLNHSGIKSKINVSENPSNPIILPIEAANFIEIPEPKVPKYEPLLTLEDFTDRSKEVAKEFLCKLCKGIYCNPLLDKCGHTYCSNCFETFLKFNREEKNEHRPCCPFTGEVLKEYPISLGIVNNILLAKEVKCKNSDANCHWLGPLAELDDHIKRDCPKQIIGCRNKGCSVSLRRELMPGHESMCPFRDVTCQYCSEVLPFNTLIKHQNDICPKISINCPQLCGILVKREEMSNHIQQDCLNTITKCPFFDIGCTMVATKKEINEHLIKGNTTHLLLMKKMIQNNKEATNALDLGLTPKVCKLRKDADRLESEVKKMQDPAYIARYAKEKYLYSTDGEYIIRID